MKRNFKLEIDPHGIATLHFDQPNSNVNTFSSATLAELESILDELKKNTAVKALRLVSAKPNIFVAGADIRELAGIQTEADALQKAQRGQAIFTQLAALSFPTIAAIDGACVGGGLECSLACDFRVVSDNPKVKLALPEVTLGIIPGWGGTQRLPRLVGLPQSLKLILTGKPVDGLTALKIGLADAVVSSAFFEESLDRFTQSVLSPADRKKAFARRKPSWQDRVLSGPLFRSTIVIKKSRQMLRQKSGEHYPAPDAALDLIEDTFGGSLSEGLEAEAVAFSKLCVTRICKNLVQLFFTSEALKKETGTDASTKPNPVNSAAVLGAGIMGGGISWLFSQNQISVRMKDLDWKPILKGLAEAQTYSLELAKRGKMKRESIPLQMHRISGTTNFSGFRNTDIVVEAVVEKLEIKKAVLAEVESQLRDDTVIATNTSALPMEELASSLKNPERFVGMHFFNPVNRMPLVEVVAGSKTNPETIATTMALVRKLGKTPILVNNCSGFLVNRILIPYLNEAALMLQEGGSVEAIDQAIERFGMPMGPFLLSDEVGLDVGLKVAKTLETAYGDRMRVAALFHGISERKELLGKKGGRGFYIHESKKRSPNPEIDEISNAVREAHQITARSLTSEEIIDRAMLIMVNEASRCLEESIVSKPEYLDMAMIMGTGYPPFHGGPLRYTDERGLSAICLKLEALRASCGDRFAAAPLLLEMEKSNKTFYQS